VSVGREHGSASAPPVALVRWLYVLVYASYGTTSVYRSLYYRRVGMDGAEIGLLIAIQPLVQVFAGPLWSLVADRLRLRSRMLTLVTAMSCLPMLGMIWWSSFSGLLVLNALYALFLGPIQPLTDSIALNALQNDRHKYSSIRAFGSLGYAPVMWAVGYLIEGLDIRIIFVGYALLMGAAALLSMRVRVDQVPLRSSVTRGLSTLVRQRLWLSFMLALFMAMAAQSVTFGYTGLYLDTLGAGESVIGLSGALGSITQTLIMLALLPLMLKRWGSQCLLLFSLAMYVLRFALLALFPVPWIVVIGEVLLGFTFGGALVAAVDFADRHAPPGMAATSQALATSFVSGLGRSAGGLLAGGLYDVVGPQNTFGLFGALSGIALGVFGGLWRRDLSTRGDVGGKALSANEPSGDMP
jgi:MFS transporter, PPP family, 3-phenylpropionic acid transporter